MYAYVELEPLTGAPAFTSLSARQGFLERASRVGAPLGVRLLAFALQPDRAALLVTGREEGLPRWAGHLRAGHALWRRHQGEELVWDEPAIIPLPGESVAVEFAQGLMRLGRPDPLADPGCALRDAVGLRESLAFDPSWLRARGSAESWMQAAGLSRAPRVHLRGPAPFLAWWQVEAAVEAATGERAGGRSQRVLRVQLATRCGWTGEALAALTGVGLAAIRRAQRCPPRPTLAAALTWARDPALRARLPGGSVSADSHQEGACPAPSSSSIKLVG
ncbi:MAG: hypothetical protein H6741_06010 [Alphaproteobacteria bacterium]|nr:hypothetical protein [Alphaproteobacteria bacterium]